MWPQNKFTDRLNLKWPILQAPMGWLSTPALAAAVSNAGGLGGLGMWGFSAEDAERRIAGFQQLSGGSLNVNYPLWPEPALPLRRASRCGRVCSRTSTRTALERYLSHEVLGVK